MPIPVSCPGCGRAYNIRDDMAGKRVRCQCGQAMRVISVASQDYKKPADDILGLLAAQPPGPTEQAMLAMPMNASAKRKHGRDSLLGPRRKKRRSKSLLFALGAVASVVTLCCTGAAVLLLTFFLRPATFLPGGAQDSLTSGKLLPTFLPDPGFSQFGPEVSFSQYAMRLPTGFSEFPIDWPVPTPPRGGSSRAWAWRSQPSERGTRCMISALVFDVGPNMDATRFYRSHMSDYFRGGPNVNVRRRKEGLFQGKYAVRVESSVTDGGRAVADQVELFWFDDRRLVLLSASAPIVEGPVRLREVTTAMMTIRAQP